MATITEDYVSFETAKLLKEKGFDGFCERFYDYYPETGEVHICGCDEHNNSIYDDEFSMPTQAMAMKWLREVHKLHIEPHIQSYKNYNGNIYNLDGELLLGFPSESPEQACEAAILYCLRNLI